MKATDEEMAARTMRIVRWDNYAETCWFVIRYDGDGRVLRRKRYFTVDGLLRGLAQWRGHVRLSARGSLAGVEPGDVSRPKG